jgi:hypothetical protein
MGNEMLNEHDEQMHAIQAENAEQNALIDEICARMGARYHDPKLYEYGNPGGFGNDGA